MNTDRLPLRITFLFLTLLLVFSVFFLTPSLRPASLLACLNVLLLSPLIHFLEKKKVSKTAAILIVFILAGGVVVSAAAYATSVLATQWHTILDLLPQLGDKVLEKIHLFEDRFQDKIGIHINLGVTGWMKKFGNNTQGWLLTHLPEIVGDLASAIFLVPLFSFFILRDGEKIMTQWISLFPPKHRTAPLKVLGKITRAMSEFLRAKTLEALIVGVLTFIGLSLVGAPYSGVFAIIAGVTNIIPYLGPFLGAAPALVVFGFSNSLELYFWPSLIIFTITNAIDLTLIFPVFVAKLVNLSPLTLLAAVAVGQEFYGLIGMLLAIPLASIFKIIYQELIQVLNHEKKPEL